MFSKVAPALWQSQRFLALTDEQRLLFLYFLTCEHQNSAGTYRLPDGYACTDLSWTPEKYKVARATLVEADLIIFDEKEQIVAIRRWFQHNPPMNDKHRKGVLNILQKLPQVACVQEMKEALEAEVQPANDSADMTKSRGSEQSTSNAHHLLATPLMKSMRR